MTGGVFAHGFLLSLSLCLDLGVVNLALMRTAMLAGLRPAVMIGLGSAIGDLVYALLSASSLALLLHHRGVRLALWLLGSAALAWLMLRMLRETLHPHALGAAADAGGEGARKARRRRPQRRLARRPTPRRPATPRTSAAASCSRSPRPRRSCGSPPSAAASSRRPRARRAPSRCSSRASRSPGSSGRSRSPRSSPARTTCWARPASACWPSPPRCCSTGSRSR
ncbi:MAG: LysE family transporter [Steroidobacteraceae bacterium]